MSEGSYFDDYEGPKELKAKDAKARADKAVAEAMAERERRKKLIAETGIAYDDDDAVEVAIVDGQNVARYGGDARDKSGKKESLKRIHEAMQKRREKSDTHIEEHHDAIVAAVELAYAKAQENNTPEKMTKLTEINETHTKRVLNREMQEDTALDAIRATKTNSR